MPSRDLRSADGTLHPLAPFIALAVMVHPNDRAAQKRMVALVEAESGEGPAKRPRLDNDAFSKELHAASHSGKVAGKLLLQGLQLHELGERTSLNRALAMTKPLLPIWEQPSAFDWHTHDPLKHTARHRQAMLEAFDRFLSVSHLWAALIHGHSWGREDIWPGSLETLPRFLGYAEAFAERASRVRWYGPERPVWLPKETRWRFVIPETLHDSPDITVLPLHPEQRDYLRQHLDSNRPN